MKQSHNAATANHHHSRLPHYGLLIRRTYAVIMFAAFIKGDTSTPSEVNACISYNSTGFPHLNLQWEDSGIDQISDIKIYYSVNGRNELNISFPYQGIDNITDITLSDVQYNDNISVQIAMQNATTMTGRSNPSLIRANPLYSITWFYIGSNLAISCELACRTEIIKGCNVSLLQESETTSMQSNVLDGTLEEISGRVSIVIFNNISPNKSTSYQASALIDGSIREFGEELLGSVSRQASINSTSGTTTIVSSPTPTASSTVIDATTSSLTVSSTTAVVNTGTPSAPLPDAQSSDNMITLIIVIGVVAIVIIVAIIIVILIVVVRKVQSKKHNNSEYLKEKSLKIDEATLPDLVRARMVSIKSEAGNIPGPYEQVDNTSNKLFKKMQSTLNPHYEAHEFKVNGENITYLSSTNAHHPSDYNQLIYSKSEEDIAPPVPNKQNYSQLQLQTHNYDEVYLDDQTAEPETIHHEYASLKFGNNESSS